MEVPEGWENSPLSKHIEIKHGFAFKSKHFKESGSLVLLTPGHFYEAGGFKEQAGKTKFYDGPVPEGYTLSEGDLVLAMTEQATGLLGSAVVIPTARKYLHNQRIGLVQPKDESAISTRFLFYFYNLPL